MKNRMEINWFLSFIAHIEQPLILRDGSNNIILFGLPFQIEEASVPIVDCSGLSRKGSPAFASPAQYGLTLPKRALSVAGSPSSELPMPNFVPLDASALPAGIRSRQVERINGLDVHILEAGFQTPGRPCLLLLHGFPELAYSWRKIMVPLAEAGFHVVAPDLRGYGRTTGWSANYDDDLTPFRMLNAVRDALGLVAALGYRETAAVVGHDFGAGVAALCALVRPDVFRSLALMS